MNSCDETREHLEGCEECRLHITVEARLRTQPVLPAPKGLVGRVMRALPRTASLGREVLRLALAASILIALAGSVLYFRLDESPTVSEVKPRLAQAWRAVTGMVSDWNPLERSER